MEMERTQLINRKRKQKQMGIDGNKKRSSVINRGIDELPDDVLINILSRLSLKESARASVLARRWRYLWRLSNSILRFDNRDTSTGNVMGREKFRSWVNTVLELLQSRYIEGMVINFEAEEYDRWIKHTAVDNWVHFATQKEVQRFELNCSHFYSCEFPSVERLISHSLGVMSSSPLCHLRTLRLVNVNIEDEVVHYFLASCPNLEELCIDFSRHEMHLRVIDPPRLRVLEINMAYIDVSTLEVSAVNLVSLTYRGGEKSLVMKKIPNLRELTMTSGDCDSFFIEPKKHGSYSVQLEKLALDIILSRSIFRKFVDCPDLPKLCSLKRLELKVYTKLWRSLVFLTPLINASPQLREFRIELKYHELTPIVTSLDNIGIEEAAKAVKFVHGKLKVVEMSRFTGNWTEKQLLLELLKIGPSVEKVVINTIKSNDIYVVYSFPGIVDEAKKRAIDLASNLPEHVKLIVT